MLTVITGPMFSGKSSALISRCIANVIADNFTIVFKPDNDNRYDKKLEKIVSHNMRSYPAVAIPSQDPGSVYDIIPTLGSTVKVVGFDEAQFFKRNEMIETVNDLMYNYDVIIAGLSQDSRGKVFGAMPELLAMADDIVSLKAVCSKCKTIGNATRTYRKEDNGEQVVIGGADKYEARCYSCWPKYKV